MAKPTKKELLEALKDPELLKEAGLQTITDKEEDELFGDIVVGDDDTMADVVKKINERTKKQLAYHKKREANVLESAKEEAGKGEKERAQAEVDSFLAEHPELSANKELMAIVEPLYQNGMKLGDAWGKGCKALDLDLTTGKAPVEKTEAEKATEAAAEKANAKKTALKSNPPPIVDLTKEGKVDDDKPKSIREIASERLNTMAADGKNPWRDS